MLTTGEHFGTMVIERNSRKIIVRLKREGWTAAGSVGSHHKFKDSTGKSIIVPHPKKDLPLGTARKIAQHAGWLKP